MKQPHELYCAEPSRPVEAITSVIRNTAFLFGRTAPFDVIPPTWYIKLMLRRRVVTVSSRDGVDFCLARARRHSQ